MLPKIRLEISGEISVNPENLRQLAVYNLISDRSLNVLAGEIDLPTKVQNFCL
jgi:hypothetical protein